MARVDLGNAIGLGRPPRLGWIGAALLLALSLPGARAQTLVDPALQVEQVAGGLNLPTTMAFIGDDDFLVVEKQTGQVRRVAAGILQVAPVLDLAVSSFSERGLLGIATDPDFRGNGFVYLYYTSSPTGADTAVREEFGENRLERYRWNGSALVDPQPLLSTTPSDRGPHNGGVIEFGPDDRLYLAIGDATLGDNDNLATQLQNNAAGPAPNDTGVIFRVNAAGHGLRDNPFASGTAADDPLRRYFAYGIRNTFGIAFDPRSGSLWQTENGPQDYDELNRVPSGFNGGFRRIRGPLDRDPEGAIDLWVAPGSSYTDPQLSWLSNVAPAGLSFVASPKLGCDLQHDLIVGDTTCRQLYKFDLDASRDNLLLSDPALQDRVIDNATDRCNEEQSTLIFGPGTAFGRVTDLLNGPDGYVYFVAYNFGRIYRIVPVPGAVSDVDGDEVDDSCDCDPTQAGSFAPPPALPRLRLSQPTTTRLGWDDLRAVAGNATAYRVVSGSLSELRDAGSFGSACALATGLPFPETTDLRDAPPVGDGWYYLVQAENACGIGPPGPSVPAGLRSSLAGPIPAC